MMWKLGKLRYSHEVTTTSGGSKALTASSPQWQFFEGTLAHDLVLPDATSTSNGSGILFSVVNASSAAITVKNFGGSTIKVVAAGASVDFLLTSHSTANGTWRVGNFTGSGGGGLGSVAPGATITSNYTLLTGDRGRVLNVDTTAGAVQITLPTPSLGFVVTIKDVGGLTPNNPITIARAGSELIDGGANSISISSSLEAVTLISDGTDWFRVGRFERLPTVIPLGLFGGGAPGPTNVIEFVAIVSLSNSSPFGTLSSSRRNLGGTSNSVKSIWAGGLGPSNTMDFVLFAAQGVATTHGTLTVARSAVGVGVVASPTRGVFMGGFISATESNVIDYVEFATTSGASDFGDLQFARSSGAACGNRTRGVTAGGFGLASYQNVIDYITIATQSNSADFGDLTQQKSGLSGCGSQTRGVFFGGSQGGSPFTTIEYITLASLGNGASFGTLTTAREQSAALGSRTRAIVAGGGTNTMEYVETATTSNSFAYGNLTSSRSDFAGTSSIHGGL